MRPTPPRSAASRPAVALLALAAALLLVASCSSDAATDTGEPALGAGGQTEPEREFPQAGEAQLAPGEGVAGDTADAAAEPGAADTTDQQPGVEDAGGFVPGEFGAIPLPTSAEPFGQPTTEDGVTVQSFQVTTDSPDEVIGFYRESLPPLGWTEGAQDESGGDQEDETQQEQATFTKDGQTLLVTAAADGALETQLTLQLSGGTK